MGSALRLAKELAELRDMVGQLSTPQLSRSSIIDGAIEQVVVRDTGDIDEFGNPVFAHDVVARFGEQPDGTNAAVILTGPTPPTPTEPTAAGGAGFLTVEWDGLFDGGETAPADFAHVAVHVADADAVDDGEIVMPSPDTVKNTIHTLDGASVTVGDLVEGTYYVSLVSVSQAGVWSEPAQYANGSPIDVLAAIEAVDAKADAALADAAAAALAAAEARAAAVAADEKAIRAQQDATIALGAANGVNKVWYATVAPTPDDGRDGDTWYVRDVNGGLTAVYERVAGAWQSRKVTSQMIDTIDAGKITTGTLSAGSYITTGDPAGTHTVLGGQALQVFRPDPDGEPVVTASLGGATADELRFTDPATSEETIALTATDGRIVANTVEADNIVTQGANIMSLIDPLPRGLVAVHYVPYGDRGINYTSALGEYGVSRVVVNVVPGRTYRVRMYGMVNFASTLTGSVNFETRLRYSYGALEPVISGSGLLPQGFTRWYSTNTASGQYYPVMTESHIYVPDTITEDVLQIAATIKVNTSGLTLQAKSQVGWPWSLEVEDMGAAWDGDTGMGAITAAGGSAAGGGAPTPPATSEVTRTRRYIAEATRSWKGSSVSDNNGYLRHGVYGGNAQRSMLAFHPQMLADVSGSRVSRVRINLTAVRWYYNNGGATNMGVHGYSNLPSDFRRDTGYSQTGIAWTSKTGSKWLTLPSGWNSGIGGAGGIRGLTFGDGDSGLSNYGYFDGKVTSTNPTRPLIEVTYTK